MSTDKFLSTGGGGNANITNGSTNIFAATLGADNLEPSKALKTNSVKQLISTNLEIADVNNLQSELNNIISNPFVGTLEATDFKTSGIVSIETAINDNTNNNTGSVTVHSDVNSSGSGDIITTLERNQIATNNTNATGSVTVHSDVTSAGSGDIITTLERNQIATNNTNATGSVTVHSDVTSAGSGDIITTVERNQIATNNTNATGSVTIHSDVTSAGSGDIITTVERNQIATNNTNATGSVTIHSDVTSAGSGQIITDAERLAIGTGGTDITALQTKTQNLTATASQSNFSNNVFINDDIPERKYNSDVTIDNDNELTSRLDSIDNFFDGDVNTSLNVFGTAYSGLSTDGQIELDMAQIKANFNNTRFIGIYTVPGIVISYIKAGGTTGQTTSITGWRINTIDTLGVVNTILFNNANQGANQTCQVNAIGLFTGGNPSDLDVIITNPSSLVDNRSATQDWTNYKLQPYEDEIKTKVSKSGDTMTGDLDIENAGQFIVNTALTGTKTREAPLHILANGKCLQLESRTGGGQKQIMEFYPQCPGTVGTIGCIQLQSMGNPTQKLELIRWSSWNGGGGTGSLDRIQFNVFTPLPAPQTQTECIRLTSAETRILNTLNASGGITTTSINGVAPRLAVGITDSPTNTNTTTEISLIPALIVGSITVPANTFQVGSSYHAVLAGPFAAANNATITIRLYGGPSANVNIGTLTYTVPSAVPTDWFECEIDFTFRSIGVAAGIISNFDFTYNDGTTFSGKRQVDAQNLDTTVNNTLGITAQWGGASTSNLIICRMFKLVQDY